LDEMGNRTNIADQPLSTSFVPYELDILQVLSIILSVKSEILF